ncbi:hypothetical protein JKP88DRAFT_179848 [Tribonema minus]|uniref:Cytochrome b5 heme-binding domain-containing protein n=1 Tax=Tribonema minus TaxID=303371 RepID=A0A835Z2S0_9STRA|nr:hypothetical protein JKP88DRAFT_179848 [Tribonema minus]
MGLCSSSDDNISREAYQVVQVISMEQVRKHNARSPHNAWVVLAGQVYDLSAFASLHPGGARHILAGV